MHRLLLGLSACVVSLAFVGNAGAADRHHGGAHYRGNVHHARVYRGGHAHSVGHRWVGRRWDAGHHRWLYLDGGRHVYYYWDPVLVRYVEVIGPC